jgi:hypothetical protein
MDVGDHPRRRRSERKAPAHPVPISVEAEGARATGEVVNLSEGGACLALDLDAAAFEVGDELILWMRPTQPRQTVPATGRVVWLAAERGRPRCGLEWTHRGPHRHWIHWLTEA